MNTILTGGEQEEEIFLVPVSKGKLVEARAAMKTAYFVKEAVTSQQQEKTPPEPDVYDKMRNGRE